MAKHLIGIDIGTSGAKSILMDVLGVVLASDFREYPLSLPQPGWAEQDPDDWVAATLASVKHLLEKSGVAASDVEGISFSGQMHGLVCLDESGTVLRPAILWCDTRTTAECHEIESAVGGRDQLISLVSNPALEGFTLPKLLWVRKHQQSVFSQIRTILLPKDYVRFRLTGNLGMDMSDAAGTLMLDVEKRCWSRELLSAVRIDPSLLPPLGESPERAGELTEAAASACGLRAGTPVIFGGADNTCAAVGNGVIAEGIVAVSVGTSGTVVAPATHPMRDAQGRAHTFNHSVPGLWYVMGVMQAAGLSLKWLRDEFGESERRLAAESGRDAYEFLAKGAEDVTAGAEGLIWLPYLNGERTPHLDANARGVLFGLTARHKKAHVVRAVMEGVAFGLRDSLEIIRGLGIPVRQIRVTGGGAASPLWKQIMADVFGQSITAIQAGEGPAYGAAILAGVGTGVYSDCADAANKLIKVGEEIHPNGGAVSVYERTYPMYRRLYADLKGAFSSSAELWRQ